MATFDNRNCDQDVIEKLEELRLLLDDLDINTDEIEDKLDSLITELQSLNSTDFATETTLGAFKTEAKSESDATQAILTDIEANQLPDNHQVTVSNPTADPETGLAKEVTLDAFKTQNSSDLQDVEDAVDELKAQVVSEDFATETTLAAFKAEAKSESDETQAKLDDVKTSVDTAEAARDADATAAQLRLDLLATESKQDEISAKLPAAVDADGNLRIAIRNQLVTREFDYVGLNYTGVNLTTVDYKSGGAGGSTVATLTLAYTGTQLDSVTKT